MHHIRGEARAASYRYVRERLFRCENKLSHYLVLLGRRPPRGVVRRKQRLKANDAGVGQRS